MQSEERINQLEIKVTYLEDYSEKLNSEIIEQSKMIQKLFKEIENIKSEYKAKLDEIIADEKPPHY